MGKPSYLLLFVSFNQSPTPSQTSSTPVPLIHKKLTGVGLKDVVYCSVFEQGKRSVRNSKILTNPFPKFQHGCHKVNKKFTCVSVSFQVITTLDIQTTVKLNFCLCV